MRLQRALSRKGLVAGLVSAAGLAALAYVRRRRRGLHFFKTLHVSAAPDAVYEFWTQFENFPGCFPNITDVRRTGNDNEWRWTITPSRGQTLQWDIWVTESIPNRSIAWESAPGSSVKCAGVVQFAESGQSSTRVDVRMSYAPANLRVANVLSAAFGPKPQSAFEEGLSRLQARFDDVPAETEDQQTH